MAKIFIMCRFVIRSNFCKPFLFPRTLACKSYTSKSSVESQASPESNVPVFNREDLDLSFEDTKKAFKSKTTWEIIRAILVLRLSTIDYLVLNHHKVIIIKIIKCILVCVLKYC